MKRSKHSLSHYKLLTCDMGELVPLTWFEALPGDSIQQASSMLLRCSPLLAPVMHPVVARIHHFFVPYRLIWTDFEDFITGGDDGTFTATPPYISSASLSEGTLGDYLGIPTGSFSPNLEFSVLPFRAYGLIFNEYFRDQDLVTERTVAKASGADSTTATTLAKVAWEKDYFTTCRPWEQKGDAITIPLGNSAPVLSDGTNFFINNGSANYQVSTDGGGALDTTLASAADIKFGKMDLTGTGLEADLSAATGIDVNDLRLALALQHYQEARAKYGSRYVEYLRYLGVRSSDARLQKPEYLGGGKQVIQFSEVIQTAEGTDPVGDMKGHGIAAMRSNRYRKFFEEHGIVMSLLSVIPKSIYTQGLHRKWFRQTKEDFYQRELAHIGDQEVYAKELYVAQADREAVFGYQARYDEYRTHPSGIAGEFRSTNNHWHYARVFTGDVALNSTFVTATPTKRVNASTSTDCLYIMCNHNIQARRPIAPRG